jgi:hypothetical protein
MSEVPMNEREIGFRDEICLLIHQASMTMISAAQLDYPASSLQLVTTRVKKCRDNARGKRKG